MNISSPYAKFMEVCTTTYVNNSKPMINIQGARSQLYAQEISS